MEETLGILGYVRLRWVRELPVEVNGSSGNSSIVTQSAPNGNHTHTHTTYSIFTSTLKYIYLLPISNFVSTEPRRAVALLRDQDPNPSRPACVYGR